MRPETELDVWPLAGEVDAACFQHAPMLATRWCLRGGGALLEAGTGRRYGVSTQIDRMLAAAVDGVIVGAVDGDGGRWRLYRWAGPDATELWALECVEEGQRRTLQAVRAAVGGVLAGAIVHELQNPLNAACLRAELLRTLIERGGSNASPHALMHQVEGLREKLNDLAGRQATLAERWLAPEREGESASQTLPVLLAEIVALMRAYYARRGLGLGAHLEIDVEQALGAAQAGALRTALCAALLMLIPEQRESAAYADVTIDAGALATPATPPTLQITLPTASGAGVLRGALAFSPEQIRAAIAFMLQRHRVDFRVADRTSLLLRLAPG